MLFALLLLLAVPSMMLGQQAHETATTATHGSEAQGSEAHAAEGHGEGHAPEKSYFGIPGWIMKIVNMLLFFGLLAWLLGGPVKGALNARAEAIRAAAAEAKERRATADKLADNIQARLSQIEQDVRAIHERAEQEGERQKKELIAAAEAEAQRILAQARSEVDNRLKAARHELTEYAGQLAAERAEAILRQTITEADRQKLFKDSLSEVGNA
jgi:F-type H+-transporting ATPase subunit b